MSNRDLIICVNNDVALETLLSLAMFVSLHLTYDDCALFVSLQLFLIAMR